MPAFPGKRTDYLPLCTTGLAVLTARTISLISGSDSLCSDFWIATWSSTNTVNSPREPSTSFTSTSGSFRNTSAARAECCLIVPQTGQCRMTTCFMMCPPC